jgi:uncharacterized membrane protein YkoI
VFIDAQTGEIKTHEPTIDWEQALEIAKEESSVSEFLDTYTVTSVNIYYDQMLNQWVVTFSDDSAGVTITAWIDAVTGEVVSVQTFSWTEFVEDYEKLPETEVE